ncbi:MAG: RdgB/HAM1 family non-canonical purine NTP pyrophosphatase [Cytophagales bacterium]|nr:RdgB/HAM1 family non-canonical purine NTP pyrophosphatase [Cytophagales bacterium]MCE2958546.1 RdgB/HAM1 family non-canonical purine NTP pyrophosphatase [Flammeovirgaceae bacterium]MCZ8071046.1 RdgB/HAM1 family non-canonical purine NTP pyrophosphatase [Cytophagales bacterium]
MILCFATNNQHKIQEVAQLLGDNFKIVSLQEIGCHEELKEEQSTIEGNSLQKAKYVFDRYHVPCFADDSGLEIEALGGEPGVHSAYYSGSRDFDANIQLVLHKLSGITQRKAQFKTVITLITADTQQQFTGLLPGSIIQEKKGTNGFGYDPIFVPDGHAKTLAQLTLQEKNKISHRSQAVKALISFLATTNR